MAARKMRRIQFLSRFSGGSPLDDCGSIQFFRVQARLLVIAMPTSSGHIRPTRSLLTLQSASTPSLAARGLKLGALSLAVTALAACAQTAAPGYYDPPAGSSITDSQYNATSASARQIVRAPSQLQISTDRLARRSAQDSHANPAADSATPPAAPGSAAQATRMAAAGDTAGGANASADTAGAPGTGSYHPAAARFAPQAQTYLGTLPCLTPGMNCAPTRMTLTLAPNGRWRARSEALAAAPGQPSATKPVLEQGCWDATTVRPIRIMLSDGQGATRADFVVQNNALRVRSFNGQAPNLDYFMSRQPDLDPISELDGSAKPSCN